VIDATARGHLMIETGSMLSHHHHRHRPEAAMSALPVEVFLEPSFVLHREEYAEGGVTYDPLSGVLVIAWDLAEATQPRQVVFPKLVEGCAVSFVLRSAPRSGAVLERDGALLMPPLVQGESVVGDIAFAPPATGGPAKPKIKVSMTIRGRQTGGG